MRRGGGQRTHTPQLFCGRIAMCGRGRMVICMYMCVCCTVGGNGVWHVGTAQNWLLELVLSFLLRLLHTYRNSRAVLSTRVSSFLSRVLLHLQIRLSSHICAPPTCVPLPLFMDMILLYIHAYIAIYITFFWATTCIHDTFDVLLSTTPRLTFFCFICTFHYFLF